MALVRSWIYGFLERHRTRYAPIDWPNDFTTEDGLEFTKLWITAFATRQVTEDEADIASISLAAEPPNFRREHIPMVVHAIEASRQEQGKTTGCPPNSLEAAQAALRAMGGCFGPDPEIDASTGVLVHDNGLGCGGTGLATRWHPKPDPAKRIGPTLQGYCTCPMGRWLKRTHAANPDTVHLAKCYLDLVREEQDNFWWLWMPPKEMTLGGFPYGFTPELPHWLQPKPKSPPIQKVD